MSAEVDRRVRSPRPPWIIPLVLAVLIALLILGVIFGPRIKDALSKSATATPVPTGTPVVVTATPPAGTSVAANNPAVFPSATAASGVGVVTPLPSTTPPPTVVGLHLGMATQPQHEVTFLQRQVDNGNAQYAFYLDPRAVVQNDLPYYGFTQGFQIVSPAPSPTPTPGKGVDGRTQVKFVVEYENKTYNVAVEQPGRQGPKGIWLIVTILPGQQQPR
jgi:hypothetical protein